MRPCFSRKAVLSLVAGAVALVGAVGLGGPANANEFEPDLAMDLSADKQTVLLGGEITYTARVANHGEGFSGATINVGLPTGFTVKSVQAPTGFDCEVYLFQNGVSCESQSGWSVPAHQERTVKVVAKAGGETGSRTASASVIAAAGDDYNLANNQDSHTIKAMRLIPMGGTLGQP